jgi:hypothetical protein
MKKGIANCVVLILVVGLCVSQAAGADLLIPTAGRVTIEAIFSEADFSNTLSVNSPTVGIAITGCDLEPAVGLGGMHILSEKISQRGCRVDLDADTTTDGVQGFPANTTFEFGMCAQTDADAECEFVWSSDPTKNSDGFDHVMTTELFPTDFPGQIFRLEWEDLENGGDQDFNDLIVVVRVQLDTDGDGLWDDWEQFGIDTNGNGTIDLDLPALGADPNRKDIFVEIDYMDCNVAGGDCAAVDTHSHEPKTAAVTAIVDAFANAATVNNPDGSTGITLHIDVDDNIPHQNMLSIDACFSGPGIGDFDDVKADPAFFGPADPRRFAYHYAIFGHRQTANTWSGCGELPGNDFIVTLGEWNTRCISRGPNGILNTIPSGDDVSTGSAIYSGPNLICNTTAAGDDVQDVINGNSPANDLDGDTLDDRTVGTVQQQAGTLMHELGHNLQLCHGGVLDPPLFTQCNTNRKPNYLSIMNYAFQTRGIQPTDPDGAGALTARVDYSPDDLDDLNENSLDETLGIGDGTDNTRYFCPTGAESIGPGIGAIDWNCDGDGGADGGVNPNVTVNINRETAFTVLTGFDDWNNLKLDFQNTEDYEDGVHVTFFDIVEMDYLTHMEIPEGVEIDIKPFSDPNSINTKKKGVTSVAICNGGPVLTSVDIDDPTDPNGFSNAVTNIDVSAIRFALGRDGNLLDTMTAPSAHDLNDPIVLGMHLTEFIDTNSDGVLDALVSLDAPNCSGDPAGPDLVVHFSTRDTGLSPGYTEACINAELTDGTKIIGCDSVRIVK